MSRIEHPDHPASRPARRMLALPILALALAVSATAVARAEPEARASTQHITLQDSSGAPYAYVRTGERGISMSGSDADLDTIRQLRRQLGGEFLWFRAGGRSYVVQDPDTLARARAAWLPLDRLGGQMDALGKQMDQHGKTMDALGKQMGTASAGLAPDQDQVQKLSRRMGELGERMGELGAEMGEGDAAERAGRQRQMADLQRQMADLSRQMAATTRSDGQRAAQASMHEIGLRMKDERKPMDALGKQMGDLGREMKRENEAAERTMRALIRESQARGLAQPAPQA